jgi:membrane protease YdiL (CAAX protease family)
MKGLMIKNLNNLIFSSENEFFKSAQNAKRLPHVAVSSFILPFLFVIVGLVFFEHVIAPFLVGDVKQLSKFWDELFLLCIPYPVMIITLFLWVKFIEKRTFYSIGFTNHNKIRKYLFGFGTGFLAMSLIVGLMAFAGNIKVNQSGVAEPAAIGGVILYLFGYIIQGGSEEIIIRGWQFQVIGTRYKPWLGALISSLFFAFMHIFNTGVNILCIINLFLFSSLLVLYIVNDGSIWSACGWHTAWNWTMSNIFGLQVSGVTGENNSILNFGSSGSQLLTGGAFGPEGSIFTTLVLLISTFFMARHIYTKESVK